MTLCKSDISGFPVLRQGKLFGMISRSDIKKAMARGIPDQPVSSISETKIIKIYPDQSLLVAFHHLKKYQISRLPIVSRLDEHHVLGIITAEDIVSKFGYRIQEEIEERIDLEEAENLE